MSAAGAPARLAARTRNLRKVYGKTVAVDHVDLEVPVGAVLGMLGPNGSGKTTTIRMLLGLVLPTAGSVELLGHKMPEGAGWALPEVGALVEGPGFHPFLSGPGEPAALSRPPSRGSRRKDIPRAVGQALERVGLSAAAEPPLPRLLARHEAAARAGVRAADPAQVRGAGRADERARPGRHPRGPRGHRRPARGRHHRARVVAPAGRGGGDLHARRRAAPGFRGRAGRAGGAARGGRRGPAGVHPGRHGRRGRVAGQPDSGPRGARPACTSTWPRPPRRRSSRRSCAPGVAVHEVRRQRTGLEELFARLTESAEQEPRPVRSGHVRGAAHDRSHG